MFSRFYKVISECFSIFKGLLYQLIENKIRSLFSPSTSDKIRIVRISPRKRIALVNSDKLSTSTARKVLELIMPAKDKEARQSYDYLTFYTGVVPFLSMPDEEALPIRKKRIVPYLHAMMNNINYSNEMNDLIYQLQTNHDKKPNTELIRDHFLSLFSRSLLGFEFPTELKNLLLNFEQSNITIYGLLPSSARRIFMLIPSIRKIRNNYDNAIKDFLISTLKKIRDNDSLYNKMNHNFLVNILLEKEGNLRHISDEKINSLANDPEIRMCVAIVLGTMNLTRVMTSLILNLKSTTIEHLIIETQSQTPSFNLDNPKILLDKIQMPLLHATFLEALRYGLQGFGITRYSTSEIKVDDIYIPPRSHVIFPFDLSTCLQNNPYTTNEFFPERFIDTKGQLRTDIKLHDGLFTPFAIGIRMCPGQHLAELIIKLYLVTILHSVKKISYSSIQFYDEKCEDTARNRALPILKDRIKFSIFQPSFCLTVENTTEAIAENIAKYCL